MRTRAPAALLKMRSRKFIFSSFVAVPFNEPLIFHTRRRIVFYLPLRRTTLFQFNYYILRDRRGWIYLFYIRKKKLHR